MKTKLFLSLGLVICCLSCSRKSDRLLSADVVEFNSYGKEISLTAHPTTISVIGAWSLAICDNILIAVSINPASIASVVNLDTENILLECGQRGRGPGEFLSVNTQKQFVIRDGHVCLWMHDSQMKSVLWDIAESIEEQKFVYLESLSPNEKYRQNNGILILPTEERFVKFPVTYDDPRDNIFFYPRYLYLSSTGEEIKELPFFNNGSFSISASDNLSVNLLIFDGLLRMKPDGTKAIDAFRYAEHLNILDLNNNSGFSISYSQGLTVDEVSSMPISEIMEKYVEVYVDATVTNEHILALYSGKPGSEGSDTAPSKSMIRIFDWDGKPLALVHVDRELKSIAYDQRAKRLYALDSEETIIYYELDNVI